MSEEALSANFLIPPDENVCAGKTLAELSCDSLKDFNPMVRVSVEKGSSFFLGLSLFASIILNVCI